LASSIDIPETILELAGIPIPDFMQGKSLTPILNNTKEKINDDILIEMNDDHNHERTRTLITDEWRITIFSDHGELYDLKNDINEINNLWNDKTLIDIKFDLLLKLFKKTNNLSNPVIRDCGY
jgi:arylsulfatase A-like enzyme